MSNTQTANSPAGSQKLRMSNIELLRIVAMLLIVAHHFAVHSGFDFSTDTISVNRLWVQLIQIGGKIGVDVFVLISGYFLINSQSVRVVRVLRFWMQLFFYSIVLFAVFTAAGLAPFGVRPLLSHLAPVTFTQWWFASAYFVLYLLSPYLNRLLQSFEPAQYIRFLLLLFVCWCLIPTFTTKPFESNSLLWFAFLYALAGYLKRFGIRTKASGGKLLLLSAVCTLLTFLSAVVFDVLGTRIRFFGTHATYFYDMQRLPVVLTSLLLFMGFLKLDIRYSRFINTVSSAMFGVYLIHECDCVRPFLWTTLFNDAAYEDSTMLIPYSLLVIAAVFVGCTLIELVRIHLIERGYMRGLERIASLLDRKLEAAVSAVSKPFLK